MSIDRCPFDNNSLVKMLNQVYGENKHTVTWYEIDNTKKEVRWKFDNQTWIQGQSFELLNVVKITGKKPLEVFKEELAKTQTGTKGCYMPNLPAMLQAWAIEFNENQKKS
ncbi:MAG: hypothetical protein ACOQNY_01420 [Mycoplasmoidaceae bacterium]